MIEPKVFAQLMGAIAVRVGKPLTDEASALYYAILSEELTTAQFQVAAKAIFRDHAYATWPAPATFIARARPSLAVESADAWAALEDVLKRRMPDRPLIPQLRACGVDDLAVATFLSIGGLTRWKSLNDFRFDEMRREFLTQYGDLQRLPAPEREAYAERKLAPPPEPARVAARSRDATPVAALLNGARSYSPGDSHD